MVEKAAKSQDKRALLLYIIFTISMAVSIALYIYSRTFAKSNRLGVTMQMDAFHSIMNRALPALLAMIICGILIALLSLVFQTISESRILTPSMIGFDSVYVGTQTLLVFMFGAVSSIFANPYLNYLVTTSIMVTVSMLMFGFILRKNKNNLIFLLMFGVVLSGVIRSGSTYLITIMDANDVIHVNAATSVNVNNMNTSIIYMAVPIIFIISMLILCRHRTYNVMSLGPGNAQGLGVNYNREVTWNLFLISLGMSVVTALIGPLAFLGLLAVNIAREMFKTHKHLHLFIGSSFLASLALVFGQGIVELLQGAVPVMVIIDLVGCSYMFYLILKENRIK